MTLSGMSIYGGIGVGLGASAKAAAVPWYLSGGIAAANCIAAYQPKGAADYATSKVNLSTPGTYDAADGAAYPTWDSTNGWKFLLSSSQYLDPGIVPASGMSFIVSFTNLVASGENAIVGYYKSGTARVSLGARNVAMGYGNGGYLEKAVRMAAGNVAVAGQKGYRNGVDEGLAIPAWSGTATTSVLIGARRREDTSGRDIYLTGYIQALAIYNTAITAPQVAAVYAAMAAL